MKKNTQEVELTRTQREWIQDRLDDDWSFPEALAALQAMEKDFEREVDVLEVLDHYADRIAEDWS